MGLLYEMNKLKTTAENLRKQGKSDEEIKRVINLMLIESKKKVNPDLYEL